MPLILLILFLAPFSAHAQPKIKTNTQYYEVPVSDVRNLAKALDRYSTAKSQTGQKFHAFTEWYVAWNYNCDVQPDQTRLKDIQLTTTINYLLPKIVPEPTDEQFKNVWQNYSQQLQTHEEGHGKIGINAARDIEVMLNQLALAGPDQCDQLYKLADKKAHQRIDRGDDARYDQRTKHGATQGADLNVWLKRYHVQ